MLSSIKEYFYIACLIVLALLLLHVYDAGEKKADEQATAAAVKQEQKDAQKITDATKIATDAVAELKAAKAAPPPATAPVVRLCPVQQPARPGNVSTIHSPGPDSNAGTGEPTVVRGPDVGPVLDQRYAQDDAQIRALQAYIRACQAAGRCAKG